MLLADVDAVVAVVVVGCVDVGCALVRVYVKCGKTRVVIAIR